MNGVYFFTGISSRPLKDDARGPPFEVLHVIDNSLIFNFLAKFKQW